MGRRYLSNEPDVKLKKNLITLSHVDKISIRNHRSTIGAVKPEAFYLHASQIPLRLCILFSDNALFCGVPGYTFAKDTAFEMTD